MTKIRRIAPQSLQPPAGPYSYAVEANGFIFVSGLLPIAPDGRKLVAEPFERQAMQVLDNLSKILHASNAAPSQLVSVRVYLTNVENWTKLNQIYMDWIGPARPARCVVPVPELHHGFAIEMEAVALASVKGGGRKSARKIV